MLVPFPGGKASGGQGLGPWTPVVGTVGHATAPSPAGCFFLTMPTPVEVFQAYEAGHSQVPAPVACDREYLGKAPSFLIADHFAQCCRGWFSIEAARLLDIDPDGALYSRVASAVGRNSALQLNALIAARLDAFLAGVFCGRRDAVTAAIPFDAPADRAA